MSARSAYVPGTFGWAEFPGNFVVVADPAGATVCLYAGEMDD